MSEGPEVEVCLVHGQRVKWPGQICNLGKGERARDEVRKGLGARRAAL